jgi:hypothetical protein
MIQINRFRFFGGGRGRLSSKPLRATSLDFAGRGASADPGTWDSEPRIQADKHRFFATLRITITVIGNVAFDAQKLILN